MTELTPPPPGRFKWTRPFRAKDENWFLRVCHHISTGLYNSCKIGGGGGGGGGCDGVGGGGGGSGDDFEVLF